MSKGLPKYVFVRYGSYLYRRKLTGHPAASAKTGLIQKVLCRVGEGLPTLYEQLAKFERRLETGHQTGTFGQIIAEYLTSQRLAEKAPATRDEYTRIVNKLMPVFAHMAPRDIERSHIAMMMDQMKARVMANRYRSVMSDIFEYAMRCGHLNENPAKGISRNTEHARGRVLETAELQAALNVAPPHYRRVMAAQALMAKPRQSDLVALRKEHITPEGVVIVESKTGRRSVVAWSDLLRQVIREALEASTCEHVFCEDLSARKRQRKRKAPPHACGEQCSAWTLDSIRLAHKRLGVDFTFHDLRSWAKSNHANPESLGMLPRYQRVRKIEPVR
ncbi:MAG: hypothetical protein AAGA68_27335 [Pseudomonadota bacterium]